MVRNWIATLVAATVLAVAVTAAAESRYVGVLADGTRIEGGELHGWASPSESPRLDGIELMRPDRPVRWLRDVTLPAFDPAAVSAAPGAAAGSVGTDAAFVELTNGDRLPGQLAEFVQPEADAPTKVPPHLVVTVEPALGVPADVQTSRVRVLPRFVRRVVWKKAADSLEPGTLFYRDGRRLAFRVLRWQKDSVRVLTADRLREALMSELAEIHLPRGDAWQAYCDELSALDLTNSARLVRLETSRGLAVTTSEPGLRPSGIGGDRNNWYHLARPAWSLDAIWVPFMTIRSRVWFSTAEMPLWRWPPVRYVSHPMLGKGWLWQLDRNVEGGPLASAKQWHGWGLGVHAPCELWFEIPPAAKSFRTHAGLDRLAGDGGCARAVVYFDRPDSEPLYRSKHLIGSTDVVDSGTLHLNPTAGDPKYLILVADAADVDRPSGADPLDIRDTLDWIEPVFLLDRSALHAELEKRAH